MRQYYVTDKMSLDEAVEFMNTLPEEAEVHQIFPLGITGLVRVVYRV